MSFLTTKTKRTTTIFIFTWLIIPQLPRTALAFTQSKEEMFFSCKEAETTTAVLRHTSSSRTSSQDDRKVMLKALADVHWEQQMQDVLGRHYTESPLRKGFLWVWIWQLTQQLNQLRCYLIITGFTRITVFKGLSAFPLWILFHGLIAWAVKFALGWDFMSGCERLF